MLFLSLTSLDVPVSLPVSSRVFMLLSGRIITYWSSFVHHFGQSVRIHEHVLLENLVAPASLIERGEYEPL